MLPFFTLMNTLFAIFNFTVSEAVLDFAYCAAVFQIFVACFMAYLWGNDS